MLTDGSPVIRSLLYAYAKKLVGDWTSQPAESLMAISSALPGAERWGSPEYKTVTVPCTHRPSFDNVGDKESKLTHAVNAPF